MFHPSLPSPAHVPRIEANGPIRKVFLPDRWNPIHVLVDPDTGTPHNHPLSLVANILYGGYVETIWCPQVGGGYIVYHNIERRPGTSHQIDADTIHLITHLPAGISITEAEPTVADRDWFHFDPRPDGSIWRSKHHNGPWESWHPAGPVEHVSRPTDELALPAAHDLEAQGIARLAPVAAAGVGIQPSQTIGAVLAQPGGEQLVEELERKRTRAQAFVDAALHGYVIGPNNTYQQAWAAMLAGHQVRLPDWGSLYSWVLSRDPQEILLVEGNDRAKWIGRAHADWANAKVQLRTDWEVLPIIDRETPTV